MSENPEPPSPDPKSTNFDWSLLKQDPSQMSIMEQIALLSPEEQEQALEGIDMETAQWDWSLWARPAQVPPKDDSWDIGLALAGRGFGKTKMAAEWVREKARDTRQGPLQFLLVARTTADVRDVIVEGRALALDTKVPSPLSPTGFLPMGKLKKNDVVLGGDGKPCRVKTVFETLYNRPCYAVKIEGQPEPVIADANHKWLVRFRYGHYGTGAMSRRAYVKTTQEILEDFDRRWYIDPVQVEGAHLDTLPYTPYNLGYILGQPPSKTLYTDHTAETRAIPEVYFWSSIEQRRLLLRGLEDARRVAGPIMNYPGSYTHALRDSVHRLTSSLGYVSSHGYRDHRTNNYSPYEERWVRYRNKTHRAIQSITPVDSVPVRCIEVDSPDNTFLITESYIKTHNSGIMRVTPPSEMPEYKPSIRRIVWPNGAQALLASADEPDSLRGPQAHYSWGDEIAAWRQPSREGELSAWENLRIATRLGDHPQILATTTPKQVPLIFDLLEEAKNNPKIWITKGSTFDNASNLAESYLQGITGIYAGTDLAIQELMGEMLEKADGALWDYDVINSSRVKTMPSQTPLRFVGVDPTVSDEPGDECGIIVVGATAERDSYLRQAWVLEDATIKGPPSMWAAKVVDTARRWGAPVVAEINQGGALVRNAIHQIDPAIPVFDVRSKVGKKLRAEPISLIYQQGRVHHVRYFPELEDQMIRWMPESSRKSPDRIDALVHALTALLIESPKGFHTGTVRAHSLADRQINLGGLRNRAPRGRIFGTSNNGFRLGGNGR